MLSYTQLFVAKLIKNRMGLYLLTDIILFLNVDFDSKLLGLLWYFVVLKNVKK
jgi:hypothetical protein